jgi:hypothetical protein
MSKRFLVALFFAVLGLLAYIPALSAQMQEDLAAFKGNSCVECHSRELTTTKLSNRYLEWHLSFHKEQGVSCDKCHGGSPSVSDKGKSHAGMTTFTEKRSKADQPAACAACHQQSVAAFTQSKHSQALKTTGEGPTCATCHEHMASAVITTPSEGAALCATCHKAGAKSPASKHLSVPGKAEEVMASIERANGIVLWSKGLLEGARGRKIDVSAEEKEFEAVVAELKDAKASWHAFTLSGVKEKADAAFTRGTKLKDALRKKMGF